MQRESRPSDFTPLPIERRTIELIAALNRNQIDFLKSELDLAHTFGRRALAMKDATVRQRNRDKARQAYETFVRLLDRVTLQPFEAEDLWGRLNLVLNDLKELGESIR